MTGRSYQLCLSTRATSQSPLQALSHAQSLHVVDLLMTRTSAERILVRVSERETSRIIWRDQQLEEGQ